MKFNVVLTWSKIMAFIIAIMAFCLSSKQDYNLFMYALPFIVALITGKQIIDIQKTKNNE